MSAQQQAKIKGGKEVATKELGGSHVQSRPGLSRMMSRVPMIPLTLEYAVDNYDIQMCQNCIESPTFHLLPDQSWSLDICPRGLPKESGGEEGHVVVCVKNMSSSTHTMACSLTVTAFDDRSATVQSYQACAAAPGNPVKPSGEIVLHLSPNVDLTNSTRVTFSLSMTCIGDPEMSVGHNFGNAPLRTLSDDLSRYFSAANDGGHPDHANSDIVLVANDGGEVFSHTAILSARSSVFRKKLSKQPPTAIGARLFFTGGRYPVPDLDSLALRSFVMFVYTDKISEADLVLHGEKLLVSAVKYRVSPLQHLAEVYLADSLMPDTAARILILAEEHQCANLTRAASEFICKHLAAVTDHDPAYRELSADQLLQVLQAQTRDSGSTGFLGGSGSGSGAEHKQD